MRRSRTGFAAGSALALTVAVLYVPLVFVVVASLNRNPLSGAWQGFTTEWYRAATGDVAVKNATSTSVRLALVSAVGATIAGTGVAVAARRRPWLRRLSLGAAGARVASPEIIMATGLALMLAQVGVRLGFRVMALAHVAYLAAYVSMLVGARAAGADPRHEEAALDLGATRWQALRDVVLPDLYPAIGASALLVTAFSFDDVALSLALRGPRDTTLPVYVLSAVQRRVTPAVYAIGVMVIVVGALAAVAALVASRAVGAGRSGTTPDRTRSG